MVVLTSTAEGKYQPSEGWKRVEEESRRAGVAKSGRFGAADLRLETILERTMRVFITTRAATRRGHRWEHDKRAASLPRLDRLCCRGRVTV